MFSGFPLIARVKQTIKYVRDGSLVGRYYRDLISPLEPIQKHCQHPPAGYTNAKMHVMIFYVPCHLFDEFKNEVPGNASISFFHAIWSAHFESFDKGIDALLFCSNACN